MKYRQIHLKRFKNAGRPRQILGFGAQWTPGMTEFIHTHMDEPAIVIASMTEAAIYGKARQVSEITRQNMRMQNIILETGM